MDMNVRAVGDLQETKDGGMAVANMTILSFDMPTRNSRIYKKDSFADSISNSPITNIAIDPLDTEHIISSKEVDPSINAADIDKKHMKADQVMALMATVIHSLAEKRMNAYFR